MRFYSFPPTTNEQLTELHEHLNRYCNVVAVFGLNCAKHVFHLIKSYLLPMFVNERDIEPEDIEKAKQFILSKVGDIQFLDRANIFGGTFILPWRHTKKS